MSKVAVGKIIGEFGTKGQVKVYFYNKPEWIDTQKAFVGESVLEVDIYPYKGKANFCIGRIEAQIGDEIWIEKALPEDHYYISELIGTEMTLNSKKIGHLVAVHEIREQNIYECSNGEYIHEKYITELAPEGIIAEYIAE